MISRIAVLDDIPRVMSLQDKYLVTNLSEAEKLNGFVTTPFSAQQIALVVGNNGLFIAETDGQIVAYAFTGTWAFFEAWPIFQVMEARLVKLNFLGQALSTQNTFQYGPICIDNTMRGTGLLQQLFETVRLSVKEQFPISITFINQVNLRSLKAHTGKLGWVVIDEFGFDNKLYCMLALDMNRSVL